MVHFTLYNSLIFVNDLNEISVALQVVLDLLQKQKALNSRVQSVMSFLLITVDSADQSLYKAYLKSKFNILQLMRGSERPEILDDVLSGSTSLFINCRGSLLQLTLQLLSILYAPTLEVGKPGSELQSLMGLTDLDWELSGHSSSSSASMVIETVGRADIGKNPMPCQQQLSAFQLFALSRKGDCFYPSNIKTHLFEFMKIAY